MRARLVGPANEDFDHVTEDRHANLKSKEKKQRLGSILIGKRLVPTPVQGVVSVLDRLIVAGSMGAWLFLRPPLQYHQARAQGKRHRREPRHVAGRWFRLEG